MPVLSTRIVLDCFYLLIFYSEKFSTDVCRLPYAVNVNLNLSIILKTSNYGGPYMQCTNIFFQCKTYIYSVHKCISECTNLFLSAQINFSVHKSISQRTNVFFSAQMWFSVHKCDSQCTIVFSQNKCIFSAQMYFSVHKYISQCTNVFLSAQLYFSVPGYMVSRAFLLLSWDIFLLLFALQIDRPSRIF